MLVELDHGGAALGCVWRRGLFEFLFVFFLVEFFYCSRVAGSLAGRPAILISSTRLRRRVDSRSSRQALKLRTSICRSCRHLPAASSSSRRSVWNEKVVVRKSAVKKVEMETTCAPGLLNAASRPSASTVPSRPPAGSAPRTSGK